MKRLALLFTLLWSGAAFAGERQVINPDQDGDLFLRVNDGGTVKDALKITGSTAALTLGPTAGLGTGYHTSYAGIVGRNGTNQRGSFASADVNVVGSNVYRDGSGTLRAISSSFALTYLDTSPNTSTGGEAFGFRTSAVAQTADAAVASVGTIASATTGGAWTFGASGGTEQHFVNGRLQINHAGATSTQGFFLSSTNTGATYIAQFDASDTNPYGVNINIGNTSSNRHILNLQSGGAGKFTFFGDGTAQFGANQVAALGAERLHIESQGDFYGLGFESNNGSSFNNFAILSANSGAPATYFYTSNQSNFGSSRQAAFVVASNAAWTFGDPSFQNAQHTMNGRLSTLQTDFINIRDVDNTVAVTDVIRFQDGSSETNGSISINPSANTTAYNTSSDARLKMDPRPIHDALLIVSMLRPLDYERRSAPGVRELGFYAQELHRVYPQAVTVGGDDPTEEPWMIDYAKLTPILAAAIQEQQAQIEALKARLDAAGIH